MACFVWLATLSEPALAAYHAEWASDMCIALSGTANLTANSFSPGAFALNNRLSQILANGN